MDKLADSSEKEKKKRKQSEYMNTLSPIEMYERALTLHEHREDEYLDGLSDAHRYVERRGFGEQDYW